MTELATSPCRGLARDLMLARSRFISCLATLSPDSGRLPSVSDEGAGASAAKRFIQRLEPDTGAAAGAATGTALSDPKLTPPPTPPLINLSQGALAAIWVTSSCKVWQNLEAILAELAAMGTVISKLI